MLGNAYRGGKCDRCLRLIHGGRWGAFLAGNEIPPRRCVGPQGRVGRTLGSVARPDAVKVHRIKRAIVTGKVRGHKRRASGCHHAIADHPIVNE